MANTPLLALLLFLYTLPLELRAKDDLIAKVAILETAREIIGDAYAADPVVRNFAHSPFSMDDRSTGGPMLHLMTRLVPAREPN